MDEQVLRERVVVLTNRLITLLKAQSFSIAELLAERTGHDVPGVYSISTPDDAMIVYVGRTKTKTIAGRIADHRSIDTNSDLRGMLKRQADLPQALDRYRVRYCKVEHDRERLLFENFAIGSLAPKLNK